MTHLLLRLAFPALALAVVLGGCRDDDSTRRDPPPVVTPACGDGKLDPEEACDGSNLKGESCTSQGFEAGTLSCSATCSLDTSGCTRRCGNGRLDPGEACDGALGPLTCASFGFKSCTPTCQIEAGTCVGTAFQRLADVSLAHGGQPVFADLAPTSERELVFAVPSLGRLTVRRFVRDQGFTSESAIDKNRTPTEVLAYDADGDGDSDLVAIDADAVLDLYRWTDASTGFVLSPVASPETCPPASFIGLLPARESLPRLLLATGCIDSSRPHRRDAVLAWKADTTARPTQVETVGLVAATLGDLDGDAGPELLYLQEGSTTLRTLHAGASGLTAGAEWVLPATGTGLAAADLDGDGRVDLAVVGTGGIQVLQNTGAGLAAVRTLGGEGFGLLAVDVDGDGRTDLAWIDGGTVTVARNEGDFTFTLLPLEAGAGLAVSLISGDAEGDGDLDLAATFALGETGSRTAVFLNQVR